MCSDTWLPEEGLDFLIDKGIGSPVEPEPVRVGLGAFFLDKPELAGTRGAARPRPSTLRICTHSMPAHEVLAG